MAKGSGVRALVALGVCALLGGAAAPARAEGRDDDAPVVRTEQGPVRGERTAAGGRFLGIPYATPPVGELRWRAPRPAPRRTGILDATRFGSPCPQVASPFGLPSVSEDCLFLNVFTPPTRLGRDRLPVLVWMHPGAFMFGESNDYDPRDLVQRGVLVVTVNYRLGALGLLAHPALSAETPTKSSGNYALMDQQEALRWVRANIARFGGDPRNVTIWGESAGGLSVHSQMASPAARGLFDRAIVESGAFSLEQPTLAEAEATGLQFGAASGCAAKDAACLRALPVATVLANQIPGTLGFLPTVDGNVLPRSIDEAFSSGRFNRVPVLEGSNHDEFRLFIPLFFDLVSGPLPAEAYPVAIAQVLGVPPDVVPQILARYPLSDFPSAGVALSTLATDGVFACNMQRATQLLSKHVTTFVYEFNDPDAPQRYLPPASFPYRAYHEAEIQYLFDITTNLPPVALNDDQERLSRNMVAYWTRFARDANPNGARTPLWIRFNERTDSFQNLVPPRPGRITGTSFGADHKCDFWNGLR